MSVSLSKNELGNNVKGNTKQSSTKIVGKIIPMSVIQQKAADRKGNNVLFEIMQSPYVMITSGKEDGEYNLYMFADKTEVSKHDLTKLNPKDLEAIGWYNIHRCMGSIDDKAYKFIVGKNNSDDIIPHAPINAIQSCYVNAIGDTVVIEGINDIEDTDRGYGD